MPASRWPPRDRPQTIAGWRPILGMSQAPAADETVAIGKAPAARPEVRPEGRHVSTLPPPAAAGPNRAGLWITVAIVLLALLGGGGYYAIASRGPDPEMVKARAAAEEAEAKRLKAEEEAAKLRADERPAPEGRAGGCLRSSSKQDADAAAKKQLEDETRRKIEARARRSRTRRATKPSARRRGGRGAQQAVDERAARPSSSSPADFDHFGKTLMIIGLEDRPDEIRLQGVDIVNDPALHKLAVDALAAQPRNLHCRQTDRLTDGTPLYRCLVTQLNAKEPLADIPDTDRTDLALALVRNGLVLASCDAPVLTPTRKTMPVAATIAMG